MFDTTTCLQYADDTQLFLSMNSTDVMSRLQTLSTCTAVVRDWYQNNHLSLNADKSDVVLGTAKQLRHAAGVSSVPVVGVSLPVSTTLKLLGVILDQRLTFDSHIAAIVKGCNYHIGALWHIQPLLSNDVAQSLACALINSRLDYCNAMLYGAPKAALDKLQQIQNTAARVVSGVHYQSDAKPLLHQLHWLPVWQNFVYKIECLTLKARTTGIPTYLNRHLIPRAAVRTTRSSALPLLTLSTTHTNFGRRAFTYSAPNVWNNLPPDVLHCNTLNTFNKHLKTHLFTSSLTSTDWPVTKHLWSSALRRYINVYYYYYYYYIVRHVTAGQLRPTSIIFITINTVVTDIPQIIRSGNNINLKTETYVKM